MNKFEKAIGKTLVEYFDMVNYPTAKDRWALNLNMKLKKQHTRFFTARLRSASVRVSVKPFLYTLRFYVTKIFVTTLYLVKELLQIYNNLTKGERQFLPQTKDLWVSLPKAL